MSFLSCTLNPQRQLIYFLIEILTKTCHLARTESYISIYFYFLREMSTKFTLWCKLEFIYILKLFQIVILSLFEFVNCNMEKFFLNRKLWLFRFHQWYIFQGLFAKMEHIFSIMIVNFLTCETSFLMQFLVNDLSLSSKTKLSMIRKSAVYYIFLAILTCFFYSLWTFLCMPSEERYFTIAIRTLSPFLNIASLFMDLDEFFLDEVWASSAKHSLSEVPVRN